MKKIIFAFLTLILVGCDTKQVDIPNLDERIADIQPEDVVESVEIVEPTTEIKDATLNIAPGLENFEAYLPTFMFHYIENVPADSPDQMRYNLSFSPEKLEEFLIYFRENNIQTLTFWDLKSIIEGEKEMPEKAVMLTFDDGHDNHYSEAFPLLEKYNMKGVFYVITDKMSNDPVHLTWDQVREIADAGHEIGSHTLTHRELNTLGLDDLKNELEASKKKIEEEINQPIISLCYPVGRYNDVVIEEAKKHYLFARTTEAGKQFKLNDAFRIPTTRIFPATGVGALATWFE